MQARRMRGALLLGALVGSGLAACTRRVPVPVEPPEDDPSAEWKALLKQSTSQEGVDYDYIEEHREILDRFVAWNSAHGPGTDEWGESKEDLRLAFLINAYNAAVIQGVLENRPLDSVRDVDVGVFRTPGAGFFFGQRFRVDNEWVSLHALEQMLIVARYQEPLVHAGLNCASKGCPPLVFFEKRSMQVQLQRAMRGWLATDQGMRPLGDSPADGYAVSQIFSWYQDDFLDWSDADTLCDWLVEYTSGPGRNWLREHAQDCPATFFPYDWSLNDAPGVGQGELQLPGALRSGSGPTLRLPATQDVDQD